jgi:hypothetical protein
MEVEVLYIVLKEKDCPRRPLQQLHFVDLTRYLPFLLALHPPLNVEGLRV